MSASPRVLMSKLPLQTTLSSIAHVASTGYNFSIKNRFAGRLLRGPQLAMPVAVGEVNGQPHA